MDGRTCLQDSLRDIQKWCQYWKLELSPEKCVAVNLSRRRGECEFDFWLQNGRIQWASSIKFLGFVFARRGGGFRHQIDYLRTKALKRLNILKALASKRYGARSRHLVSIALASICSLVNYGAPVLSVACSSLFKRLEVINTSALRIALGLPCWSPNVVVRMHARAPELVERVRSLAVRFWIKQISLGVWSPLWDLLQESNSSVEDFDHDLGLPDLLAEVAGCREAVIPFHFPRPFPGSKVRILTAELPFQQSQLCPELVVALFLDYVASLGEHYELIGTDASKSDLRTSVAGCSSGRQFGYLTNSVNSIFSAEALAISLALDELVSLNRSVAIFSDSLSVLKALLNISLHSPRIILWLHSKIRMVAARVPEVIICWVPGHSGIDINERADKIACSVDDNNVMIDWISPEDLSAFVRRRMFAKLQSDYDGSCYPSVIGSVPSIDTSGGWARNRREDVLITRLLCHMHVTPAVLHRFSLSPSDLCVRCGRSDSLEHILFVCSRYSDQRQNFFAHWISSLFYCSFKEFLEFFCKDRAFRVRTLAFLKATDRF